ncbi:MAG: RsmB/NOP family class I SAM-dependent RNA methyltransferase [Blautia sp.]|nr:RsmB/NOP family class I SAM-dependent RNA methyltransferase [Blautia sp.]
MAEKQLLLPEAFLARMQSLLGGDYPAFLNSYSNPRTYGLRVNTAKISCEEFEQIVPFSVKRIPWIPDGYFYPEDVRPSRCPLYQAGLYYLQEPSAMTPASRLPVVPGQKVLDLCAAPGGKATALGAALMGDGLLLANDVSASRAKALLRNLELFGITNALVTSEPVSKLAERFPAYFDKIMLDAPCSGEGMFRKEDALAQDWSPEKSDSLAQVQRELILHAADMLKPGGMLLYSTCTFAPAEDEGTISYLLANRPDMTLSKIPGYEGFADGIPSCGNGDPELTKCVRIFPHRMNGEGHFLALLTKQPDGAFSEGAQDFRESAAGRRSGKASKNKAAAQPGRPDKQSLALIRTLFDEIGITAIGGRAVDDTRIAVFGEKAYYLPSVPVDTREINFLRHGLYLGDLKKNRFEPSQPLALALRKGEAAAIVTLSLGDERIAQYLRGESISVTPGETSVQSGWALLTADGHPLAFGKLVNGVLKNKYPAGWRGI